MVEIPFQGILFQVLRQEIPPADRYQGIIQGESILEYGGAQGAARLRRVLDLVPVILGRWIRHVDGPEERERGIRTQ